MSISIVKVRLVAAPEPPFVGTRIGIDTRLVGGASPEWMIYALFFESKHESGVIDWGDGTKEVIKSDGSEDASTKEIRHTYARHGAYEVKVSDDFRNMTLSHQDETLRPAYTPMVTSFKSDATLLRALGSSALANSVNLTTLDLTTTPIPSLSRQTFAECTSLATLVGLPSGLTALQTGVFLNDTALVGRVDLPQVVDLSGTSTAIPQFSGCNGITEIHFAAENEAKIRASEVFKTYPTLGAENATVIFDL